MATNFKINSRWNGEKLHLKLAGDFDGSSAYELVNALKKHEGDTKHIVVHTDDLSAVYPFGIDIFRKNYTTKKMRNRLSFSGDHSEELFLAKYR